MPLGQCEAAKIFWRTPELVEKLLPFLDLDTTLHLAQTHRVTRELLNKSFVWNKLIRRSCPSHDGKDFHDFTPSHDEKMSTVLRLVAILKLVKTPKVLVMDLLELICARFERIRHDGEVLVSCSSHPGRIFSYCVRARACTHVLARVYSTHASTCTLYTCFTLPPTCVNPTGLQLSIFQQYWSFVTNIRTSMLPNKFYGRAQPN